jgi:ribonuclease BN (tRNA processing enzyme)
MITHEDSPLALARHVDAIRDQCCGRFVFGGFAVALAMSLLQADGLAAQDVPSRTQIVLLGTGTPAADPDRSGASTAIVVDDTPYLVDFGPGVVRRAAGAVDKGVSALRGANLRVAFVTHLHSDHTAGYADLIITPWVAGRTSPLEIYGPRGIKEMTEHLLEAYRIDIDNRMQERGETSILVAAHEIAAGLVYEDARVQVSAFKVSHGDLDAYGYRFETPDRVIVISGDTSPTENIVSSCDGCDVLIHEHYSVASFARVEPRWQQYRLRHHTSTQQLAELATRARPDLLILYHRSNPGAGGASAPESDVIQEMGRFYHGRWVSGRDLEIY